MKRILLLTLISITILCLNAQDGITLHFMRLNPYSAYTNPSVHLQYTGYIGIPGISNVNASFTNTSARYKTLFGSDENGTITTIKLNTFAGQLSGKGNMLNSNVSLNIIDFGFQTKPIRFSFSYRIRMDEYCSYNKDLMNLPIHGNMMYLGEYNPAKPDLRVNLNAYQEIALGMQFEVNSRLYLGLRPKLLFGLANVKTKYANATLYTDPDDYTVKLNYNLNATMACAIPYSINKDQDGNMSIHFDPADFLDNWQNAFKNVGAAIDLGMTFRINDMFGVAASVLDLGFIHWTTNCNQITGSINETSTYYNDGSFIFDGFTREELSQIAEDPINLSNKLQEFFPIEFTHTKAYTKSLASRFLVEGYCNVGKYHRFSALFQGRIINKQFVPSFTVAWNGNFLDIFDLCVSYTMAKRSYANLGLGVGFNLKVFHLYVATDNIFGFFNSKSIQRSILNAHNANVQLGLVFDWGKTPEKIITKKARRNFEEISLLTR
jgi:hypothetical protein